MVKNACGMCSVVAASTKSCCWNWGMWFSCQCYTMNSNQDPVPIKLAQLHFATLGPGSWIRVIEGQRQLHRETLHILFLGKVDWCSLLLLFWSCFTHYCLKEALWDAGQACSQPGMSPLLCHHTSAEHLNCSGFGGGFLGCCSTMILFVLLRFSYLSIKLKRRLPPKALLSFSMCGSEVLWNLWKIAKIFKIKKILILCS